MLIRVISLFFPVFFVMLPNIMNVAKAENIDHSACVRAARRMPLVTLMYNYGNLGFDHTKSKSQVSQICRSEAAGCFHHSFGEYYVEAKRKIINVDGRHCTVPQITARFDFSGAAIYVGKEHTSCTARVILRHELQHFTIWKTAVDEMLQEAKISLKNLALQDVYYCNKNGPCTSNITGEAFGLVKQLVHKWQAISKRNNERLDEVDHDNETEFAYRSCSPYSLKVISKLQ